MTKPFVYEESHGRTRVVATRPSDGGPPPLLATVETAPDRDPKTGRFKAGNRAARRRAAKSLARVGVMTLDPARVASWLSPEVAQGASYALSLATSGPPHPALVALAGDVADVRSVARALLRLGTTGEGDPVALKEARAWFRESRAMLAAYAALSGSGVAKTDGDGPDERWLVPAGDAGEEHDP